MKSSEAENDVLDIQFAEASDDVDHAIEEDAVRADVEERTRIFQQSDIETSEDEEYRPVDESDHDVLSTEFEESSDDEYLTIRALKKKFKKKKGTNEVVPIIVEGTSNANFNVEVPITVHPTNLIEGEPTTFEAPNDGYISEYEASEDEIVTPETSQEGVQVPMEEGHKRKKFRNKVYNPKCDVNNVKLELGMKFESNAQFKEAVQSYCIVNDYNIRWTRTCCRPIIGFDGCFLKMFLGGQLLFVVGRDENNQIFPIAWAVVKGENYESWSWFLGLLFDDLGIAQGYGLTLISDQQKRVPAVEHRNCARHIYANWKKKHPGHVLKSLFWRAVRCTIESDFKKTMSELQTTSDRAHQDFLAVGVTKFCQTYISVGCKSDVVSNNLSETFNGYIPKTRGKLIIDMLEDIRRMLMERMYKKRELMLKSNDTICPSIRKKLEKNKEETRYCHVTPTGNMKFEVQELDKSSVVNLMNRTCSCRKWDLCGIPCNHAISCINWLKDDPDQYVDDYCKRDTYLKTYYLMLQPLTRKDT
ncbi:hypothetical protein Cni_G18551 [Canna indica]|uniref:SWIM-type domain-containing protein n=1 Tax=Canna indica TaxID=4628 RepID=A0AAQ3KJ26_9LILI|nr:hypothetical protein Cni_G18551 [Canna indica]